MKLILAAFIISASVISITGHKWVRPECVWLAVGIVVYMQSWRDCKGIQADINREGHSKK